MKIMQIIEFNARIMKIITNIKFICENQENHESLRIPSKTTRKSLQWYNHKRESGT